MAQFPDSKHNSSESIDRTASATSEPSRDSHSEFIPLTRATRHLPERVNASTVWRWCRKGVLARSGRRVFLRHSRLGGRIYVTQDWIDAFGQELAKEDSQHFSQREAETPSDQQGYIAARSNVDLAAELEAEGL